MLVLSLVSIGPSSFLHSAACFGPALLPLDSGNLEFSFSIRQMICLEPFTSAAGVAWMGLLPFVLDPVHPEFSTFLQSSARFELLLPVLDSVHSGFPLFAQGVACLEPVLFVPDSACFGFSLSLQGCSQVDPASFVVDLTHSGF